MATIILSSSTVPEDAVEGDIVGTLSIDGGAEGETFTFALNDPRFEIVGGDNDGVYELVVKAGAEFDYEAGPRQFAFTIHATGSQGTSVTPLPVNVAVTDMNEAPEVSFTPMDVPEGAGATMVVGTLTSSDPEQNPVSYTLLGNSANLFSIDANGKVVVREGVTLDLDNPSHLSISVQISDGTNTFSDIFDLNIVENQEPVISFEGEELAKTVPGGTIVGALTATDNENDPIVHTLVGASAELFRIDGEGNVVVRDGVTLDYNNSDHRHFTVTVFDGVNTLEESFDLNFLNDQENQEPVLTWTSRPVLEGAQAGTVVGILTATDPESDPLKYKLIGTSDRLFRLEANGQGGYDIVVNAGVSLDYENDAHHTVLIEVSDGTNTVPDFLQLNLIDVDEPPDVTFTPSKVSEGVGGGTVVGTLLATDPEGSDVSCELSAASAKLFKLVNNHQGGYNIVVLDGVKLDYENSNHRTVRVTLSDGTREISKNIEIGLVDQVDLVTGTARSDSLRGGTGSDILKGLAGNDRLSGGAGDDWLYGGAGRDTLVGDSGKNVFVFDSKPNKRTNFDVVWDYDVKDDAIWLDNKVFTKLGKSGSVTNPAALNKSFFTVGTKAKDKNDYLIYNKKTGILSYDADGSGSKAAVEIALLKKGLAMKTTEFFVI